jgi:hypothetical protein
MAPRAKGDRIELVSNECGIVEGSLDGPTLRAVVTSGDSARCWRLLWRHCGEQVPRRARRARCDKCGIVAGLVNPGIWADLVSVALSSADLS